MQGLQSELGTGAASIWLEGCERAAWVAWLEAYERTARSATRVATTVVDAMPFLGARPTLHWERIGSGPPVLLIMGLGLSGGAWWRTLPVLAQALEVITFDNRGVGRSRALFHAYSTEVMADDAVSVLDGAGVDSAHVYGISLGGMVAQQVAIRHPGRVRSLVLGATSAGGPRARQPDPQVLLFLRRRLWMHHEEAAWSSVRFNYGARCRTAHPERIREDVAQRLTQSFSSGAYRAQLWAAMTHNASGRLTRIKAPTLVVHGGEDMMIPVENGRMIAERIPGAQLLELPGTGHLYPTEAPEVDVEIRAFMRRHD
jgi:pimeloyl-ACP methyl ester carboxylesterase